MIYSTKIEIKIIMSGKNNFHTSARKQFHRRRLHRTVSHELRRAALGGARRWASIFITLPGERYDCYEKRYVCICYIYIVYLIVPRDRKDKYMYRNARFCSSGSLTYTARQNRLLWSFYMPQYENYLTRL